MCYITRNVYTVCAHTRIGGVVECEHQKARNERWEEGNCCLALLSCRPVEKTKLKYWFCDECREHYDGCDTKTLDAVLNYWAFKNARGCSSSVSPRKIPAELVFGGRAPVREDDPKRPRLELVALGKVLPRKPFESPLDWLQRLEEARTMTVQLAERCSSVQGRESRLDEHVVHMQPRISAPMSVYPYSHALSSITELSEARESTVNSVPSHNSGASRQVHPETLRKLCGEPSVEMLPRQSGETDQKQQRTDLRSCVSAPVGHEVAPDAHPPHPSYKPPARPLSRGLTPSRNSQQGDSQGHLADPTAASQEPTNEAAGAAVDGTSGETGTGSGSTDQVGDTVDNSLPTGPSQGALTEKEEPAQHPEADDGHFTDVPLDEAPSKQEKDESDEPNMTSHFSISDIDPDDAVELARALNAVSPVSITVALDETDNTGSRGQEPAASENHELAVVCMAPDIVAPQPKRNATPPRFVEEYDASAAENKSETGES
jgi:hypothetical protein